MNKKRAFTLLEVMIVIILISIIAAFAIPTYSKSQQRANEKDMVNNLILLHDAVIIYQGRFDAFPGAGPFDLNELNTLLNTNILANQKVYQYTTTDPLVDFTITSDYIPPGGSTVTIEINQGKIDLVSNPPNPCCLTINCLVIQGDCL